MSLLRILPRAVRIVPAAGRPLSTSIPRYLAKEREHETTPEWREIQKSKATGPHLTNTTSTIANEMPSVGADKAPPELLTTADPNFTPKDSIPENTEHMTGGTQKGAPESGVNAELDVGEMEGAKFKVEPIRRTGEDDNTMRARLLCPFASTPSFNYSEVPMLMRMLLPQTRVERGGPSKVTSSSPPLPITTYLA